MPLKHERKCSSMYHSRADEAAAASVTPARAISCARAEHRAPACTAQAREQEQQHVSRPSRRSRGGERHACDSDQLRSSRASCASLCCSSTGAREAACFEAKPTKQLQRAPRLLLQSAANEPSSERQPVPLKQESKSGIVYRSRAGEAAAVSITPRTAISCARSKRRAPACATQARARAASCIEAELMKQRRRAPRLGWRSASHEPSVERQPVPLKHERRCSGSITAEPTKPRRRASRLLG